MGGKGSGGANRLPDEIKKASGTLRKDRSKPDAPQIDVVEVPAPQPGLDDTERTIWLRLKQAVDHLGVYGAEDYDAFVMTVSVRSNYERLRLSPDATQKELIAAQRAVKEWLSVFGLTPQSRSTVSIKGKKPEDSAFKRIFDDLMN